MNAHHAPRRGGRSPFPGPVVAAGRYDPAHHHVLGGTMRRTAVLLACLLALAGCSSGKSEEEVAKECRAALTDAATKTDRPSECEGLSQDDYEALLMAWVLQQEGLAPSP